MLYKQPCFNLQCTKAGLNKHKHKTEIFAYKQRKEQKNQVQSCFTSLTFHTIAKIQFQPRADIFDQSLWVSPIHRPGANQ